MRSPAALALGFFAVALVVEAAAIAAVTGLGAPRALLNLWPLSVGMIGFLAVARAAPSRRGRALGLLAVATLAFALEIARELWPGARVAWNLGLVALLAVALAAMARLPVPEVGAEIRRRDLRLALLGALLGAIPTAGPYLVLRLLGSEALRPNPDWAHAEAPLAGLLHVAIAGAVLLLNTLVGEEAGWRGFLASRLRDRTSRRGLVLGTSLLFALWHVPFDLAVQGMDPVNLAINQATRLLAGVAYLHVFVASGGRLLAVSVFHAVHNVVVYEVIGPDAPLAPALKGLEGLGYAGLYLLLMGLVAWAAGRLSRNEMRAWVRRDAAPERAAAG